MKSVIATIIVLISFVVRISHGYMCYECNSLNDTHCFDLSPLSNVYVGVMCESTEKVKRTCYSAHVSVNKKRNMERGCKNVGYCDVLEQREQSNIFFKVLGCGECNEHFCNNSSKLSALSILLILLLSLVHFYSLKLI